MFVVRPMIEEDIPQVCQILEQMPGRAGRNKDNDRDPVEYFKQYIKDYPHYFVWVVEVEKVVAGSLMMHLQYKLSYGCGVSAHLEDFVIDEKFRRKGLGDELLLTAISKAKEHDCFKVMTTCWESTGSVEFYRRMGFEQYDIGMRLKLK